MQDDTTLAVPALGLPVDGPSEVVRMAVREAIEAATEARPRRCSRGSSVQPQWNLRKASGPRLSLG